MLYVLAVLLPPLATLAVGAVSSTIVNLLLCLTIFPLPQLHALYVVHQHRKVQQAINVVIHNQTSAPSV